MLHQLEFEVGGAEFGRRHLVRWCVFFVMMMMIGKGRGNQEFGGHVGCNGNRLSYRKACLFHHGLQKGNRIQNDFGALNQTVVGTQIGLDGSGSHQRDIDEVPENGQVDNGFHDEWHDQFSPRCLIGQGQNPKGRYDRCGRNRALRTGQETHQDTRQGSVLLELGLAHQSCNGRTESGIDQEGKGFAEIGQECHGSRL